MTGRLWRRGIGQWIRAVRRRSELTPWLRGGIGKGVDEGGEWEENKGRLEVHRV